MVRETSKESHQINQQTALFAPIRVRVLEELRTRGLCTRRELAAFMNIETATMSGIITPMLAAGQLEETGVKCKCSVSGRNANVLRLSWSR